MSQSSRHKAIRPVREREQVARDLATLPWVSAIKVKPEHILRGISKFDVHAAREYARDLVRGLVRGYADNDHARNQCTLGLRILDALEGQPSKCRACRATGKQPAWQPTPPYVCARSCNACKGTGHNLRGVLPAVEWSAQSVRWATDGSRSGTGLCDLQARIISEANAASMDWPPDMPTRVVPRGEHRHLGVRDPDHDLDRRISERRWCTWDDEHKPGLDARPRWERGEERHAAKRLARAAERRGAA